MKEIKTKADLEQLLSLEKAIVFIFLERSGAAHLSKKTIDEWQKQTELTIPFFEINPENSNELNTWVYENDVHGHGYGSIIWLKEGKILGFVKDAGKFKSLHLEEKTFELFR